MTSRSAKLSVRPPFFSYRKNGNQPATLQCEESSLAVLAKRFDTPLYVYSASMIRNRVQTFDRAFRNVPHTICYSVKANSNLSILRLLARMGCGFDVVSGGELERVLCVSRSAASKVVFSGVGKTREEIQAALKAGILVFNVESESELMTLAECASRAKKIAPVAFRVNPDVPANTHPYISTGLHRHKFGIPIAEAVRLYSQAARNSCLNVAGVSVHIGSQITDVEPFNAAMQKVADLVRRLRAAGHAIRFIDAGGGLGIPYNNASAADFNKQVSQYADALLKPLRELKVHLLLEPGRSIIGPAGILLTKVLYRKKNDGKRFLVVDAAMNDLMRPSLYGAHHEIVSVEALGEQKFETVDVVGPVCESGDFFARDRKLPIIAEGDLIAILDAGAYGMAIASNYNTRPRAAEVLVENKSVKLVRKRETIKEMLKSEM